MPWRLFPWARVAKRDGDDGDRRADVALRAVIAAGNVLRESHDRIQAAAERLEEASGRRTRPEHS